VLLDPLIQIIEVMIGIQVGRSDWSPNHPEQPPKFCGEKPAHGKNFNSLAVKLMCMTSPLL
jgi:hypothetical protein